MNDEFRDFADNLLSLVGAVVFYGCMFGAVYLVWSFLELGAIL